MASCLAAARAWQAAPAEAGNHDLRADTATIDRPRSPHRDLAFDRSTRVMSGSTFGELFRVTNFGESHGPAIGCVIDAARRMA